MSVITEDGAYYSFNVKYAREPRILNVEMTDFIHDGEAVRSAQRDACLSKNRTNNSMNIYLKELGSESPVLVRLVMMIGVLALTMGQASAQRCLPKMQGIEVNGCFVDGKALSAAFSGGVALSTYTKNGSKWVFGGEYLQREYGYSDTTIPVAQFTAEGGYYQKLLTDGSKTLFVSMAVPLYWRGTRV